MPFKTLKKKVASEQRREAIAAAYSYGQEGGTARRLENRKVDDKKTSVLPAVKVSTKTIGDLTNVKADLVKIVIAATIIIMVQITLGLTLS